jgi:putative CRISPR-associated protein (TIGR02619 family)
MVKERSVLICTVGTSLFESNLRKIDDSLILKDKKYEKIKFAFQGKRWDELASLLLTIDPKDRFCGAEINTIEEYLSKKRISIKRIFFLVSDTEDGVNTGKVLKSYFTKKKELKLKDDDVDYRKIEDLQDKDPKKFKINGLRNLVREIGDIISKFGKENIAIDATGGYKAQIAMAVIIGQALDIPVYYKHERFFEIIDFAPLPITLDYDLLGKYSSIFIEAENNMQIKYKKFYESSTIEGIEDYEKIKLFFEEVDIDGEKWLSLNAIGQLYITSFNLRYKKPLDLPDSKKEEREEPTFRDDHYPDNFIEFVKKIWRENKYIKTCKSLPYDKQRSMKGIEFYVYDNGKEKYLVGTYEDRNNFKARFRIFLSKDTIENMNWAAFSLTNKYRDKNK